RQVSKAQPEAAAYHFTTLTPVLGVVTISGDRSFVLADIPGLIEGAGEGVGLGHDFLRHVERTKVLVHVLDIAETEGRDAVEDFETINAELAKYSEKLAKKKQIVAANKIDLLTEDDEKLKRLKKYMNEQDIEVYPVCAVSGEGLHELLERVWTLIGEYEPEADDSDEEVLYKPEVKADFEVSRDDDGAFVITGMRIERLVAMTKFDDDQTVRRFQRIWRYMELDKMLKEAGIEDGDTVRIYSTEFEYHQ
uniref:Obg family GTPase CgtA n=1 Tax=Megasphaera micronuciformis TaxID=187326 RepID=UPI0040264303